jgi:hypothetical protein
MHDGDLRIGKRLLLSVSQQTYKRRGDDIFRQLAPSL